LLNALGWLVNCPGLILMLNSPVHAPPLPSSILKKTALTSVIWYSVILPPLPEANQTSVSSTPLEEKTNGLAAVGDWLTVTPAPDVSPKGSDVEPATPIPVNGVPDELSTTIQIAPVFVTAVSGS
jgi:hypothetical protein